jgi:hypothetical protein
MATAGGQSPTRRCWATPASRIRAFRRGRVVVPVAIATCALALLPVGCGGSDKTLDPLVSRVDQSRDAVALSSLQKALVIAALVRAESGSYGAGPDDLAQRLQSRDPSMRFSTALSSGPEQIQVQGGGAAPAMLVVQSTSMNYLAIWSDGATTAYYRGVQPPALPAQQPAGGGWSAQPVVLRPVSG